MHEPLYIVKLPDGTSFELTLVEGGSFLMGSEVSEEKKTGHKVMLSRFYMAKYPTTQALWKAVMGPENTPFTFPGDRRPAERISWYDSAVFCNRLSEQQSMMPYYYAEAGLNQVYGKTAAGWELPNGGNVFLNPAANGFRLPTEAEWEFAARGGVESQGFEYAGSNRLKEVGWYDSNSYGETKPVGMKAPNELGIYDMSGNVWEWCQDWFDESYYEECHRQGIIENPQGPVASTSRVLRGGSWSLVPQYCRCSNRGINRPEYRHYLIGFRLVLPFQSAG